MSGFAFGAFSTYWTTLVFFLEKPPYRYGAQMAGLLGLAGVTGALASPAVGLISDRGYPRLASGCALFIGMIAFGWLSTAAGTITRLAIGGIVLDLGTQANLVHQSDARVQVDPGGTQPHQHGLHGHLLCRRRARHFPGRVRVELVAMEWLWS
jgi:hypothetical protein